MKEIQTGRDIKGLSSSPIPLVIKIERGRVFYLLPFKKKKESFTFASVSFGSSPMRRPNLSSIWSQWSSLELLSRDGDARTTKGSLREVAEQFLAEGRANRPLQQQAIRPSMSLRNFQNEITVRYFCLCGREEKWTAAKMGEESIKRFCSFYRLQWRILRLLFVFFRVVLYVPTKNASYTHF